MGEGTRLTEVGQIALTVSDVRRATAFYRDVLGLPFLFAAGKMAFLQCGALRLMLTEPEAVGPVGGTVVYFRVEDIEGAYREIKERGGMFVNAPHVVAKMPDHVLWMVFLRDLDGNLMGLMSEVRG